MAECAWLERIADELLAGTEAPTPINAFDLAWGLGLEVVGDDGVGSQTLDIAVGVANGTDKPHEQHAELSAKIARWRLRLRGIEPTTARVDYLARAQMLRRVEFAFDARRWRSDVDALHSKHRFAPRRFIELRLVDLADEIRPRLVAL